MVETKSILIVDDETMIRNILKRILRKAGYDISEAKDGKEAIELFETDGDFDVVILDLNLPGIYDGKTIFDRIKKNRPTQKIIISTGLIDNDEEDYFLSAGASAVLEKPFQIGELISLIQ